MGHIEFTFKATGIDAEKFEAWFVRTYPNGLMRVNHDGLLEVISFDGIEESFLGDAFYAFLDGVDEAFSSIAYEATFFERARITDSRLCELEAKREHGIRSVLDRVEYDRMRIEGLIALPELRSFIDETQKFNWRSALWDDEAGRPSYGADADEFVGENAERFLFDLAFAAGYDLDEYELDNVPLVEAFMLIFLLEVAAFHDAQFDAYLNGALPNTLDKLLGVSAKYNLTSIEAQLKTIISTSSAGCLDDD